MLTVARRSAAGEWTAILNQMRHICFTAPDELRQRFQDLNPITLVRTCAALKPRRSDDDIVRFTTLSTLRELGRRALFLREQKKRLDADMKPLIDDIAPGLIAVFGVGYHVAATLLIAAGDNPHRIRSEAAWAHLCASVSRIPASSGKVQRHRLNPGATASELGAPQDHGHPHGLRRPHPRLHDQTHQRRQDIGETSRMLKRYIAREVYHHLPTTMT